MHSHLTVKNPEDGKVVSSNQQSVVGKLDDRSAEMMTAEVMHALWQCEGFQRLLLDLLSQTFQSHLEIVTTKLKKNTC